MRQLVCSLLLAPALCVGCARPRAQVPHTTLEPVPGFEVDGKPFCFAGSNNYYAIYKPRPMVDALFDAARKLDLRVMRIWGMLDRGSLDGSVPNADGSGDKDGVYFQYWDSAQKRPAYNDGENGLQRLDYALAAAAARNVKVIVVLVNNWRAFGGMDQYLMWYGRDKHDEFFSAEEPRQAYRDWLAHVIGRQNSVNGRFYREDATIFGWELANEPRCKGGSTYDRNDGWSSETITTWASEMSGYIKSLDPNHLVSVGDEGFLNANGNHFAYRANDGVDHAALTALPHVDFGTFHLYPEDWGTPPGFGERWIQDHLSVAQRLNKPTVLEEYGFKAGPSGLSARTHAYQSWNGLVLERGGSAALSWMLAGDGYPDYDHFAFYQGDATGRQLAQYARQFAQAPACVRQSSGRKESPFVSVFSPQTPVALGWVAPVL